MKHRDWGDWRQILWPLLFGLVVALFLILFFISCTTHYRKYYSQPDYRGTPYSNFTSTGTGTSTGTDYTENYRDAFELDDWSERGNASVEASPRFSKGVRLACRGSKELPALAAAIYRFRAPDAVSFKLRVYYRDVSRENKAAVKVFVKTENEKREEARVGDTFLLRREEMSETLHLSRSRYEINGIIEVHIVAQNQDVVDIKKIELEPVEKEPQIRVVKKYYSDFWTHYPRYRYIYHYYYYSDRYYWPRGYRLYVRYTWPDYYYWRTWRPHYTSYVKVYVKRPRWHRSYVSTYDDPPVYSHKNDPDLIRVRKRRARVASSLRGENSKKSYSSKEESRKRRRDQRSRQNQSRNRINNNKKKDEHEDEDEDEDEKERKRRRKKRRDNSKKKTRRKNRKKRR